MPVDGGGTDEAEAPAPLEPAPVRSGRGVFDVVEMGERVFLRRPDEADQDEFLAMVAASRALHSQWIRPPAEPRDYGTFLMRSRKRTGTSFVVCLLPDGGIVGVLNLIEISPRLRTAYCSYYVHARFAGQGLMTEAFQLLLRHTFATLGLQALGANIQPGNTTSIALVQRAGMRPERAPPRYLRLAGVWRGHPTWSITAQRWRQLREAAER
jgi:ribosomal-protein-alanine N-acetyltransferase